MSPEDSRPPDEAAPASAASRDAIQTQATPPPSERSHAALLADLPPGLAVPGYQLIRELSRGGQGVIYQAIQTSTQRKVAIKVLLEGPYASASARHRFEREIDLVAHLKHPSIIAVFDSGTTPDGRLFYVMDYVRGAPVTDYVRQQKLTIEQMLNLFASICEAVNHAHQKGVIHRDIKPSNILVDGEGNLHILDFGLAKAVTERAETLATTTGQMLGTLPYMSPEQTLGNPDMIDTRTDVYALGVILYEMLTGHYPYPVAGEIADVLRHITQTPPTPPSRCWTRDSGVPTRSTHPIRAGRCPIDEEVETITLKALAKERERRYQSAGELAKDIRHHLAGEPIEAKRDSAIYLLKKILKRYRAAAAVALTFVLMLVLFALGMTFQSRRLAIERDRAVRNEEVAITNKRLAEERQVEIWLLAGDSLARSGQVIEARQNYMQAWEHAHKLCLPEIGALTALMGSAGDAPPLMGFYGESAGVGGFSQHSKNVTSLVLLRDERTAITSAEDATLRMWDLRTGALIRTFTGHDSGVKFVALAPDDRTILSASQTGQIWLWDVQTGARLRQLAKVNKDVWALAFSPDGKTALAGSADGKIRKWNLQAPSTPPTLFNRLHEGAVAYISFAPDGRTALSASHKGGIWLWDVNSGTVIRQFTDGHRAEVNCVAFTPDGLRAISGGFDNAIILWNVQTGREIRRFTGHANWVWRVALSENAKTAISGSEDGTVRLWDVDKGTQIRSFVGQTGPALGVALARDGLTAVSSGTFSSLRVWDCRPDSGIGLKDTPDPITSAALSNDHMVLYGTAAGDLVLWDAATKKRLSTFKGHAGPVRRLALSPDSRYALSAADDGLLKLWDLLASKDIRSFTGHQATTACLAFVQNDKLALFCTRNKPPELWNLENDQLIRPLQGRADSVIYAAISPDGRTAISIGDDAAFRLWELPTGRMIREFPGLSGRTPAGLALSQEGNIAWTACSDGRLRAWDTLRSVPIRSLTGHSGPATCIALSPDGSFAVSAGQDKTLRLWDFHQPIRYREFEGLVNDARTKLQSNPDDPTALATFAQWLAFRGKDDWAIELLEKARAAGLEPSAQSLILARCYWRVGNLPAAQREFDQARHAGQASPAYLDHCLRAVSPPAP